MAKKTGPESVPGVTGRKMAATEAGRNPYTGQSQGELVRHPQGSNGGVHRGPDRKPRINVCRAIFMEALAGSQIRLVRLPGKQRGRRVVVEMAGKADMVKGLQLILERGARGLGLKEFIKTVDVTEKVFRVQPHETKNGVSQPPRPATFVRPTETASGTEEPKASASPPTDPGTLIGPDGQEYGLSE